MTDLELIFTMLGEKVTTEISQQENPDGMPKNKKVTKRGGNVAGSLSSTPFNWLRIMIVTWYN